MGYRTLALLFAAIVVFFVICNYLVWKLWTEGLLTDVRSKGGDLSRLGYLHKSKYLRENIIDLPRRHVEIKDYDDRAVDMITIGDSFSNGGAGGKNRFYQDYIATRFGFEVLNIPRHRDISPLTTASLLNNNGFLDRIKPKFILVEVTETSCFELAEPVNFEQTLTGEQLKRLKVIDYTLPLPKIAFINNGNVKFLLNNVLYRVSNHALFGEVYRGRLTANMFSVPDSNMLLFLRYKFASGAVVRNVNDNLNAFADRLATKGVRLIFMPCVGKYNLYRDFLVNKSFPAGSFFQELRTLPKRYIFVDTKAILSEELLKGEQDVFYADDTHWSWKASERIIATMKLD